MDEARYAIALGSNRRHGRHGAPAAVIAAALDELRAAGVVVAAVAPVIATAAWGPAGRGFANSAAIVHTELGPVEMLALLKAIETRMGRRRGRRWGQRVIDLDILLWSGGQWPRRSPEKSRGLVIPHRGLALRPFVLTPLSAIAPGWRHPRSGLDISHLAARLARRRPVDRVGGGQ